MKKRLRSRVLAVGMVGCSALAGAGAVLLLQSQDQLHAQDKTAPDKPTAAEALKRGQALLDQQQYAEAKKVLQDVDPAQLPEEQRGQLAQLKLQVDSAMAASSSSSTAFDNGKAALESGQLAQAAKLFSSVVDSPNAPANLKQNASIQLALVREKQKEKAPAMKALLVDAQKAFDEGRLDEAQNALYTIEATGFAPGSDLGWQDSAKPAQLQRKIAEKRVAMAQAPATPTIAVATPANPTTPTTPTTVAVVAAPAPDTAVAVAAPATAVAPATAASTGGDIMSETLAAEQIQRERILVLFNNDLLASQNALKAADYDRAVDQADAARAVMETGKQFFSDAEYRQYSGQAGDQYRAAVKARISAQEVATTKAGNEAALAEAKKAEEREKTRQLTVNRLMGEAHAAYSQQQLPQAAGLLQQILKIDPTNNTAALMLQIVTDRINYYAYKDLTHKMSSEGVRQNLDSEEHLIPYMDLLIYPEDWPEISRRRQGEQTTGDSEANRKTRDRLETEIGELSAEQQSFEKVIKYLAESQNVNIFVNWPALTTAGIDKNTQLSVNLHNVPFRKALTTVLSEAGGATSPLAYTIDDGVITISTKDELNSERYRVVRVYDIRDMLVQPDQNINPPQFDMQNITANGNVQAGGGGQVAGGGGGGLFGGAGAGAQAAQPQQTRADIVKEILTTIKATVAPTSWVDNGGTIGSIVELNGQLIVNQTVDNQLAVYNLLQQLRETRAIQISIEARLLLVSNNFLDDFGFSWGVTIPAGNLGGNVGVTTINSNASTLAVAPSTGITGNLGGGALGGNALDVTTSILDSWTLNMLLRATQADKRTSNVQAPRVTLFNGQRGYLAVTNQQNFISNFNQTVAAGGLAGAAATGTNLTVSTLTTGIVLDVEATVSADRRYVVMKLKPQLSSLDGIDTFGNLNGAATTATATSVPGSNLNFIPGGIFLQLPRITFTTVDTMVSVPDGGTLLIGGQKLVGESEVEIGVPILSKIPGLNRLFTNRTFTRDERTLLILVRPKIIIQREEEFKTFGMNFDTVPTNASSMIPNAPAGAPITPVAPAAGAGAAKAP